ncbi:MAG: dihydrofolate reductase [Halioglobus sp.]|jgi:dihydrofolate reductase
MGRKTYEDHRSALPGCLNIVVSTQQDYQTAEGIELVHSLPDAIDLANENSHDIFAWNTELLQNHPIDKHHQFAFKVYRHHR